MTALWKPIHNGMGLFCVPIRCGLAMQYFDIQRAADEAGIPAEGVGRLQQTIRREFPRDEMMYELHVLRACMAIRDGLITLEQAVGGEPTSEKDLGIKT